NADCGIHDCLCIYACLFFFFQAEDGIRDRTVTGVQTCALPISSAPQTGTRAAPTTPAGRRRIRAAGPPRAGRDPGRGPGPEVMRSEERRVGKECRSRWSAYQ